MEPQKIVVGPIGGTLQTNVLPFNTDNDSFPVLINAYQWRGRVKRKRGTSLLGRLNRFFDSTNPAYGSIGSLIINGSFQQNILTGFNLTTDAPNASIIPGSVTVTDTNRGRIYTDAANSGILKPNVGSSGTINYITGLITLTSGSVGDTITANFLYYPDLPVMGLRTAALNSGTFHNYIGFDTTYSYNILNSSPYQIYDITFYKNPTSLAPYVSKTTWTPFTWNGQNYQLFWSTNFQNAFWVTNGIPVPFSPSNIGMQFAPASSITYVSNTSTTITLIIATSPSVNGNLVIGDYVFLNEWTDNKAGASAITLNFQTGYVTAASGGASNTVTITLPNANVALATVYTPGIVQYLTNVSNATTDCLRWYDGDPTLGTNPPTFGTSKGWVNFTPPLSRANFSISDLPLNQYYLVGARVIFPFHDRLLFFGPVVQTSTGTPIYLQDTVIWSQNGTPFYTASFTGDPSLATTVYNALLVPTNQTATASAWWEDQPGFGGYKQLGIDYPLLSCTRNEDVLIIGSLGGEVRCVYTGTDLDPFQFYFISSEFNTSSTFSAVNLGSAVFSRGDKGIILTSQRESNRIDVPILDQNMQMNLIGNGAERITAERDFINEWIYLTYKGKNIYTYPTQTLLYNYRDDSWAIFNEAYTCYGQFRRRSGFTWATIGSQYATWSAWNVPWNAGASTLLSPEVIAGNQQGFVLFRDSGTDEATSLYIQAVASNGVITSPDHCLNAGDYIVISGVLGITGLGGIYSVVNPTVNTFALNPIPTVVGTYIGGGLIQRMYVPFIQTRQFPTAWAMGRKTRIGVQQYLLSTTEAGQIQLLIYLSQDASNPYNIPPDDPDQSSPIIYTTTLFTSFESGTDIYSNTLMAINGGGGSSPQQQMWHRQSTSLIGDSVQLGFTMSDTQMRDVTFSNQFSEIELHGFILNVTPSQILA